jgi:hypothetical protein
LRAELEAERSKEFWQRLFDGQPGLREPGGVENRGVATG